ncbi:MAG: hypothetical protein K2X47_03375, partial [Bdellovibrionales bacterium]|nr:hypothetical protein [Bdellovibrionales bacterium]
FMLRATHKDLVSHLEEGDWDEILKQNGNSVRSAMENASAADFASVVADSTHPESSIRAAVASENNGSFANFGYNPFTRLLLLAESTSQESSSVYEGVMRDIRRLLITERDLEVGGLPRLQSSVEFLMVRNENILETRLAGIKDSQSDRALRFFAKLRSDLLSLLKPHADSQNTSVRDRALAIEKILRILPGTQTVDGIQRLRKQFRGLFVSEVAGEKSHQTHYPMHLSPAVPLDELVVGLKITCPALASPKVTTP